VNNKKGGFIPVYGHYKKLISYQKSLIIYDCTFIFCKRFFNKYDRTIDQMVQAARSGKQNIIEGSMASGTSTETEIKLTNVARASLEELLEDYRDYLRTGEFLLWDKNSEKATYVRKLSSGKIPLPKNNTVTCETGETYGENNISGKSLNSSLNSYSFQESQKSHSFEEELRLAFVKFFNTRSADVCANIAICLINQCTYLT
jgi:four helix bundle protein